MAGHLQCSALGGGRITSHIVGPCPQPGRGTWLDSYCSFVVAAPVLHVRRDGCAMFLWYGTLGGEGRRPRSRRRVARGVGLVGGAVGHRRQLGRLRRVRVVREQSWPRPDSERIRPSLRQGPNKAWAGSTASCRGRRNLGTLRTNFGVLEPGPGRDGPSPNGVRTSLVWPDLSCEKVVDTVGVLQSRGTRHASSSWRVGGSGAPVR